MVSTKKLNKYFEKLSINLVVVNRIGRGSFGQVFEGIWNGNERVAVKVEVASESDSLEQEAKVYNLLQDDFKNASVSTSSSSSSSNGGSTSDSDGCNVTASYYPGIPRNLYYHSHEKGYRVLVIPLLGDNLADILYKMKKFSPRTTALIAKQVIGHLKYIHSKDYVNKDIKPENLMIKSGSGLEGSLIYMVDFGLSHRYFRKGKHIPNRTRDHIEGTTRYMGIHTHQGEETSRRDDFQSLAYTLIYFLKGKLPWQSIHKSNGHSFSSDCEKRDAVYHWKKSISSSELCLGLPSIFEEFLVYTQTLRFDEEPDYDTWQEKFFEFMKNDENRPIKYEVEWMKNNIKNKSKK